MSINPIYLLVRSSPLPCLQIVRSDLTDPWNLQLLEWKVCEFVRKRRPEGLILDLRSVKKCNRYTIPPLVRVYHALQRTGDEQSLTYPQVRLCGLNRHLIDWIRRRNMDGPLFRFYSNINDALDGVDVNFPETDAAVG